MSACKEHQLFDGISHVMNNAMRDYISPLQVFAEGKAKKHKMLQEMFEQMQRFVYKEVLSDLEIADNYRLASVQLASAQLASSLASLPLTCFASKESTRFQRLNSLPGGK